MISIEEQIAFVEHEVERIGGILQQGIENKNQFLIDVYQETTENMKAVLTTLVTIQSNGSPLQANKKKCSGCNKWFTPINQSQEACSGKCRVRIHRNNNRMKNFNAKVNGILKQKNIEAKFTVEQQIVENGKCPFVVTYKETTYKANNTKSLLTQLKKIEL